MLTVNQAVSLILGRVSPLAREEVALLEGRARVVRERVRARRNVPPFDNSAMDGFAVRWQDVKLSSPEKPVRLAVIDEVAAGYVSKKKVSQGKAIKIMTGASVPRGADTIVRVEYTEAGDTWVQIRGADKAGAHIRKAGEDIATGQVVLHEGKILSAADIGLLASIGRQTVRVGRRPVVGIVATGDELANVGEKLRPGQIVNSNSYTLSCAVEQVGGIPRLLGIVRDKRRDLARAFEKALAYDAVITSGGVSVGDYDFVKEALDDIGVEMGFWKVAQRPGHPMAFGSMGKKPVFGLPGNPVSSAISFLLYVRPALLKMMGCKKLFLPVVRARLEHDIVTAYGLKEFVRCCLETRNGTFFASSTGTQSSGVLRSLSMAQGLVVSRERQTVLRKGSKVPVILLGAHDAALQEEMGF